MALDDLDDDDSWDIVIMRTNTSTGGRLSICYNDDLVKASPSSSDDSTIVGDMRFPNKTNITIGKSFGKDNYPDIAIMSQDEGIFFLNHTGVHSYTLIAPSGMTVDKFNTTSSTTRPAQLSCMISGDIDGDGLDDLIVGTMRNPRGEDINGDKILEYNRMSKGAIFVVINGKPFPTGWQRYLVDDPARRFVAWP